jgi:1,4-dihydroxy-2-naphthoate octaprenyltransferase
MKLQAWIKAARLRTLPLSLSGIIAGSFAAFEQGYWDTTIFTLAMLTTLFLQVLSNFANDLGDSYKGADNENRVGPERAIQSGAISQKAMTGGVILFSVLALATAIPLIIIGTREMPSSVLWTYVLLAIACVVAAITYTVGKKAYGYHGLGDLMVLLFFGFVSVVGVYTLYSKQIDISIFGLAICFGLLSVAVLNLNNMRDHVNDEAVNKKTLVVAIGFRFAKIYHVLLVIISFVAYIYFIVYHSHLIGLIAVLPFIYLFIHLIKVWRTNDPRTLDPELKKVALSTFFIAVLFSISTFL